MRRLRTTCAKPAALALDRQTGQSLDARTTTTSHTYLRRHCHHPRQAHITRHQHIPQTICERPRVELLTKPTYPSPVRALPHFFHPIIITVFALTKTIIDVKHGIPWVFSRAQCVNRLSSSLLQHKSIDAWL